VGFCGGGATPVYLAALNEYREPKYSRGWIDLYGDEPRRLAAAKLFQVERAAQVVAAWARLPEITVSPEPAVAAYLTAVESCATTEGLLLTEAAFTKQLYALLSRNFGTTFTRKPRSADAANTHLDAGNYLAYGLAGCCLWVLGIPHSYPVMHGKTRRGALVFDLADVIKDAYIMPNAFIAAAKGETESEARKRMLVELHDSKALQALFRVVLACLNK
jgi:CRISPR-associated protein Cas1